MKKNNSLSSLTQEELRELMEMGVDPSQIFSVELPKHQINPNVGPFKPKVNPGVGIGQPLPLILTPKGARASSLPPAGPVSKPNVVDPTPNSFDPFGSQEAENRYYYQQTRNNYDALGMPRVNDDGSKNYYTQFGFELRNQKDNLADVNQGIKEGLSYMGAAGSYLNNFRNTSRNQLDNMRSKQNSVFGGQPEYEPYNFDFVGEVDPLFGLQARDGAEINLSHNGGGVDIEAEGGEFYLDPTFGATIPIEGPSHEEGGVKFKAKDGSYILSDHVRIPGSLLNQILRKDLVKPKQTMTIADAIRKFPKHFDTQKESETLTDKSIDPIKKRSIELNMRRKLNNLSQLLAYQQEQNNNNGEEQQEQETPEMQKGGGITLGGVTITGKKSTPKKDRSFSLDLNLDPFFTNSEYSPLYDVNRYNRLSEVPDKGVLYDKNTGEILSALPDPNMDSMDVREYQEYANQANSNSGLEQLQLLNELDMEDFQEAPRLSNTYDIYSDLEDVLQQFRNGTVDESGILPKHQTDPNVTSQGSSSVVEGGTGAVTSNNDYFKAFAKPYHDTWTDQRTGRVKDLNEPWKYRMIVDPTLLNNPSVATQVVGQWNASPKGTKQVYKLNDQGKLVTTNYTGPMYKGAEGELPLIQSATQGFPGFFGGVTPISMRNLAVYNLVNKNDQEYNKLDEAGKNKMYAEAMGLQSFDPNDYASTNANANANFAALMKQINVKFPNYASQAQQMGQDLNRLGIDQIEGITSFPGSGGGGGGGGKTKCVCDTAAKKIISGVPETDPRAGVECAGDYAKLCEPSTQGEPTYICDKDGNIVKAPAGVTGYKTEAEARATCPGTPPGTKPTPSGEKLPIEYGLGLLPDPRSTNYRETYNLERYDPRLISLRSLKNESISQMDAMNRAAGFDPASMAGNQAQAYGATMDRLGAISEKENITNVGILNEAEKYNTEIGMKEQALQQAANKKFVDENNADMASIIDDRFSRLKSLYEAQNSVNQYNQALKFGQSMYGDMYQIGDGTIDRNNKPITFNANAVMQLLQAALGSAEKKRKGGKNTKRIIY